jgi:heme A synthase
VVVPSVGGALAIIHGSLAQAFFALTAILALTTSAGWKRRPQIAPAAAGGGLKRLGLMTTSFAYLQIISGAILTHTGRFLHVHLLFAALVAVHVVLLAVRVLRRHSDQPPLTRLGSILLPLLALQLLLGLGSYVARFTSVEIPYAAFIGLGLPTTHRVIAGLMLGACIVLTLRAYRLGTPEGGLASQGFAAEQVQT